MKLSIVTEQKRVRNYVPSKGCGLAIIGEAPGEDEELYGMPFIGASGRLLNAVLREHGVVREACFVGNVCQVRPPANNISAFSWDGWQIQEGLQALAADLASYKPRCCLLLGNTALRAAKGSGAKVSDWRGSIFISSEPGPLFGLKCVATYHPAAVLRDFKLFPLFKFDVKRAWDEAQVEGFVPPQRSLRIDCSAQELCFVLDNWQSGKPVCVDIEGGLPLDKVHPKVLQKCTKQERLNRFNLHCIGFASGPDKAWVIPVHRLSEPDLMNVLRSFARLMARDDVPKILQNQLYDNFVLTYGYGIPIWNVREDVMIKSWELFAELPRSLAVQASIWTREPHWKDDTMYVVRGDNLLRGCAMDTAVTYEICLKQDEHLSPTSRQHYETVIALQRPFLYMELRGIRYDSEGVRKHLAAVEAEMAELRERIEQHCGRQVVGDNGGLSPKRLTEVLYHVLHYPPQYAKGEGGRKTDKLTSDKEALLRIYRSHRDDFIRWILRYRHLESLKETLSITADDDGRVRCAYSLEAETGRVRCYTSPTGSGANLQTITKELRKYYLADPGCDFFQCDLEGADGWTVAAHCARLGDSTMIDDYLAGMKPAKLIALMYYFGKSINQLSRSDLKWLHDRVFPIVQKEVGKWLYLGSKRVQHGSNYLMGIPTMQLNVMLDSYKESGEPLYLEFSDAKQLQDCYFSRYPGVKLWHNWMEAKIVGSGTLTAASGHCRVFFGRRYGDGLKETVKEALAHEPQANTTWATNLAMLRLWRDPANRVAKVQGDFVTTEDGTMHYVPERKLVPGALLVEPLHQVHDALCGQWPQSIRAWATKKLREWFDNTITIAGVQVKIPFDGAYGSSWGNLTNKI